MLVQFIEYIDVLNIKFNIIQTHASKTLLTENPHVCFLMVFNPNPFFFIYI